MMYELLNEELNGRDSCRVDAETLEGLTKGMDCKILSQDDFFLPSLGYLDKGWTEDETQSMQNLARNFVTYGTKGFIPLEMQKIAHVDEAVKSLKSIKQMSPGDVNRITYDGRKYIAIALKDTHCTGIYFVR